MDSPEEGNKAEHADRTGLQPRAAPWPKVTSDYHGALVRLTTMRAAKAQHLLFGYVEFFPRDTPVAEGFNAGDRPWTVPNFGGDVTLGVSALPMSVADALAWYERAAMGQVTIPGAIPVALNAPRLGAEPALGGFCIGEAVPFAARWHDGPRTHRLVPMEDPPEAVTHLGTCAAARAWLADNAGFDPFDFEEWLGSLSLLAPDPLHTGVGHFTMGRKAYGSERAYLQAHRRHFADYPVADADALNLVLLQRRPSGWAEVLPASFDADGFVTKDSREPSSEVGYAISCPVRGLLRMAEPASRMEQINIGMGVVGTILDVEVPAGGRRKPAARYQTSRVTDTGGVQVGEALPFSGAIRLVQLQEARKDRIRRESAPQCLFGVCGAEKDDLTSDDLQQLRGKAEAYVANLVAGARRRVVFVDPDFGVREFQNYALRVMRDGVEVTVLTGAPHMRRGRAGDTTTDALGEAPTPPPAQPGVQMLQQLEHVQRVLGSGAPEVWVMPSAKKPIFHDRFLVIDDGVWALGPSFNELGERIGLISLVREPQVVIEAVEQALDRSTRLADWVAGAESSSDEPDAPHV
jgi:hypothetical protein